MDAAANLSPEELAAPATQQQAYGVLLPSLIGWALQFFLSGVVADRSLRVLRRRNANKFAGTALAKPLFLAASLCNLGVGAICIWNIGYYTVVQDRSVRSITTYKLPDMLGLAFGAPTSICTQTFMAIRCWKVTNRNIPVLVLTSICILTAAAGSIWATTVVGMLQHGDLDDNQRLFLPTVLWLIGNVVTDLIITVVFTVYLLRLKKGTKYSHTGSFVNALIRLAFETCGIPLFVTLFSAIMRAVSTLSPTLAHMATATILCIPSLYLFSFIYCLEGTAARKRDHERQRRGLEGANLQGSRITGSSDEPSGEGRRGEKHAEKRAQQVQTYREQQQQHHHQRQQRGLKLDLHLGRRSSVPRRASAPATATLMKDLSLQSSMRSPIPWEPPSNWGSSIEQKAEELPRLSQSLSRDSDIESAFVQPFAAYLSPTDANGGGLAPVEEVLTPSSEKDLSTAFMPVLMQHDPPAPAPPRTSISDLSRRPSHIHIQVDQVQTVSARRDSDEIKDT